MNNACTSPQLRRQPLRPGDIVTIENLGSHKGKACAAPQVQGSPSCRLSDLNPVEQVFAKLKTLLRKAAETG